MAARQRPHPTESACVWYACDRLCAMWAFVRVALNASLALFTVAVEAHGPYQHGGGFPGELTRGF